MPAGTVLETCTSFLAVTIGAGRTVLRSLMRTAVRMKNFGLDSDNAEKGRDSLQHRKPRGYATISVNIVQQNLTLYLTQSV